MSPYPNANVRIKMWARISDVLDPQREALWLFNRAVVTEKSGIHYKLETTILVSYSEI